MYKSNTKSNCTIWNRSVPDSHVTADSCWVLAIVLVSAGKVWIISCPLKTSALWCEVLKADVAVICLCSDERFLAAIFEVVLNSHPTLCATWRICLELCTVVANNYEGRSINKLQNDIILLI